MPRKKKDIYDRINEKEYQIKDIKSKLALYESELSELNKEKESMEMRKIFDAAREHNLNYQQVVDMISRSTK